MAAERRRRLAFKVAGGGDGADKRARPPTTASTKVTPDAKQGRRDHSSDIEPRALSFSEADTADTSGGDC